MGIGRDYTIFAKVAGYVEYTKTRIQRGQRPPRFIQYIHVRPTTKEEHMERVRARVQARNDKPLRNKLWTLTQMGHFADRGAPKASAA